jgi:hypothetical protein
MWMVVSLVEPPGLHVCPTHDAGLTITSVVDTADPAHTHHDAGAPTESPARGEHGSHDGGACLCLGECDGASRAATAPPPQVVDVIAIVPVAPLPGLPAFAPVTRGGLVLPFANGPPVRA